MIEDLLVPMSDKDPRVKTLSRKLSDIFQGVYLTHCVKMMCYVITLSKVLMTQSIQSNHLVGKLVMEFHNA